MFIIQEPMDIVKSLYFFSEIVNKTFYNHLVQTLRILSISGHCLNVNLAKAITRGLAVSSNAWRIK